MKSRKAIYTIFAIPAAATIAYSAKKEMDATERRQKEGWYCDKYITIPQGSFCMEWRKKEVAKPNKDNAANPCKP